LLAIGAIVVEGVARNYTYNGDHPIPSEIDHYKEQEFRDFYDTYTSPTWLPHTNLRGVGPPASVLPQTFSDLDFSAFYVIFRGNGTEKWTTLSCAFNWTELIESERLNATTPCEFDVSDDDAQQCIGTWTATKFKDYWCSLYDEAIAWEQWAASHNQEDRQKRQARKELERRAVNSVAAFYHHNSFLIAVLIVGLVVVVIAVALDTYLRRTAYYDDDDETP
jgi:hypothetical protein